MTAAVIEQDLASFVREIRKPECWRDPYAHYHRLRQHGPIIRTADDKFVVLSHRLCSAILKNPRWEHFPELLCMSSQIFEKKARGTSPHAPIRPEILDAIPDRSGLRGRLAREFRPRLMRTLRPRIGEIADALLDEVQSVDFTDLIESLVIPFTSTAMGESFGVPPMDRHLFRKWSKTLRGAAEASFVPAGARASTTRAEVDEVSHEVAAYMKGLVSERRRAPNGDLLSALVSGPRDQNQWSDDEIVSTIVSIIVVGHHTTSAFVGNGIVALLNHPGQFAKLRENPQIAREAVAELLRYDAPAQLISRFALEEMRLGDQPIVPGDIALMLIGAANRDPEAFAEPDRLDLTRSPNDHLAFSAGHAACFGAPLADVAGQILFPKLAQRLPGLTFAAEPVQFDTIGLRGIAELPVRTG
ncbi:MAG TPA: cytochrome P450 [Streptosporangiaceae bacterium]|nr:cytochrome P450 [Streptosporangiaceae bacterium]